MVSEERWYEVFISSTSEDLGEIRQKLILSTITTGHIPSSMELFKGLEYKTTDMINKYIARANLFVAIIGYRWGTEIGSTGESFTEYELRKAKEYRKNLLIFLMKDDEARKKRANLPNDSIESSHESEYQTLRNLAETNDDGTHRHTITFSDYSELPTLYTLNLQEAIKKLEGKGGWVRGDLYDRSIHLNESVSKNRFFKRFVDRLNTFDILSNRCSIEEPLKIAIAEVFWDQYLARMIENGVRSFFFESGSSIAMVAELFIERLKAEKWLRDISEELDIGTNNILVYLDFILSDQVTYIEKVHLYPRSQPEAKYGATFGSKLITVPRREPPRRASVLTAKAEDAVSEIFKEINEQYPPDKSVILMAASGIDTNSKEFPGPHVGSYYNKLFKKALLASLSPKVIFLDEKKVLEKPFTEGDCYSVCDKDGEHSWNKILEARPIAMAIASSTEEKNLKIIEEITDLGFKVELSKYYNNKINCERDLCNSNIHAEVPKRIDTYTVIATNQKFQELWRE